MVTGRSITRWVSALSGVLVLSVSNLYSQQTPHDSDVKALERLSSSVQSVVSKVAPAIVRIEVLGYGRANEDGDEEGPADHLVTRRDSIASGIILDSNGYIVTNAHVVEGARRVHVI